MIKIEKVFFCDSIEYGQYWKLNITGLIPTNTLAFNIFPYKFITYWAIVGQVGSEQEKFSFNVYVENIDNITINEFHYQIEISKQQGITNILSILPPLALNFDIYEPWSILIQIVSEDTIIYWEEYNIITGESPSSKVTEHMPLSGTFWKLANNVNIDFITKLLLSATHSLRIIDGYIDSEEFVNLLKNVDKWVKVQILTGDISAKVSNDLKDYFIDIEIKKTNDIHDRYIKIDDSEYYHFGHSMKDIAKWKTCSYTKKSNQAEIDVFETTFNTIWNLKYVSK